jgi:hypothetical protein
MPPLTSHRRFRAYSPSDDRSPQPSPPAYSATSPSYSPTSPSYKPQDGIRLRTFSPVVDGRYRFSPTVSLSPTARVGKTYKPVATSVPTSPSYKPTSPSYNPTSPAYSPTSPSYKPQDPPRVERFSAVFDCFRQFSPVYVGRSRLSPTVSLSSVGKTYKPTSPYVPRSPRITPAPERKKRAAAPSGKLPVFSASINGKRNASVKRPRKEYPLTPLSPTADGIIRSKLRWGEQNLDAIEPWARSRFARERFGPPDAGRLIRTRAAKKRNQSAFEAKDHARHRIHQSEEEILLCSEDFLDCVRPRA